MGRRNHEPNRSGDRFFLFYIRRVSLHIEKGDIFMIQEQVTLGEFVQGKVVKEYMDHPTNNQRIFNLYRLLETVSSEVLGEYISVIQNLSERKGYDNLKNSILIELKNRTR